MEKVRSSTIDAVKEEEEDCLGIDPASVHVLLVDDDRLSTFVVSNMLEKLGFRVTSFDSGVEVLEALNEMEFPYNLVLTDVGMPEVSGIQVLKAIRSHPVHHSLPVIFLSSYQNAGIVVTSMQRGADDYLFKPVELKELHCLWRHIVRRRAEEKRRVQEGSSVGFGSLQIRSSLSEGERGAMQSLQGGTDSGVSEGAEDAEDADEFGIFTRSELREHCLREIEKYQQVLKIVENFPEMFPERHPD